MRELTAPGASASAGEWAAAGYNEIGAMDDEKNRYLPIAIGFYLLAAPLAAAVFLAHSLTGKLTNAVAAAAMAGLGLLLHRRRA